MTSKYRNVVKAVFSTPWAILPEKFSAIVELLEFRAAGGEYTQEEIAARIGTRPNHGIGAQSSGNVALIPIHGVISPRMGALEQSSGGASAESISRAIDAAMADDSISAIVLDIDSPGGSVFGIQELAAKIRASSEKKRVIAVGTGQVASAAYWAGASAGEFVLQPSAQAGSIGVLSIHADDSEKEAKAGVKYQITSAGKHKAEGWDGPLSEEALTARQKMVDSYYQAFVGDVAKGRGVTVGAVRNDFGEGRMVMAHDAVAIGMADRVATLEQVLNELGVGTAVANSSASKPAFSLKGISMDPKVFGLLVRIGMCQIDATDSQATNALERFFAVKGVAKPAVDAEVVAALEAHVAASKATISAVAAPLNLPVAATDDRAENILAAVKIAGLADGMTVAAEMIADKSVTLEAALQRISGLQTAVQKPAGTAAIVPLAASRDKFHTEARDALLVRVFGGKNPERIFDSRARDYIDWKPQSGALSNRSLSSTMRLCEMCLIQDGFSQQAVSQLEDFEVAQLAMGVASPRSFGLMAYSDGPAYNNTGMFPNILLDAQNVAMRSNYDDSNTTYQSWMKRGESLRDFKLTHKAVAGELGDPKAIPEDGEFAETTMADSKEAYRLTTWGQVFSITWQAVVNDQLSAFIEIPTKQGRAMKRKQNRLAYGVLKDNATMADTGALFNATAQTTAGGHNNLATGAGAPSVTTLNTLTTKMMELRGLESNGAALGIMPKFLIAPPALRGTVLELLGSTSYVQANSNSGVKNIWQNGLEPVIEAELGTSSGGLDTSWYLASDWRDSEHIEYAFLKGLETPRLDQSPAFDRLALRYRIYQAFAVHAVEYRGLQKHAGA